MTRIVAVSGGLGNPSSTRLLAERLSESVAGRVQAPSRRLISLRELAPEITDAIVTGFASPSLQQVFDELDAADAVIAVSPVFKASYSGLFKSFVDAMEPDLLVGKPVIIAATGGTARHSLVIEHALRPLFAYLQAIVMPTGVFASPHDWGSGGGQALDARIDRAAAELTSILDGAGTGRVRDDGVDLFSETMLSISGTHGTGVPPGL